MKKVFALMAFFVACSFTTLMAQGGGQQMDPAQRMAMMKDRLKDVGLTPIQTDSVVAIYLERPAIMANMRDMSAEDRQAAMKTIADARQKRMEKNGLSADQIKKVQEALAMGRGMGGGQRPPGGGN